MKKSRNRVEENIMEAWFWYHVRRLRLSLVGVKSIPENISFSENAIFRKGKCIQVFGCVGIRFTENQVRCLVRTNIYRT